MRPVIRRRLWGFDVWRRCDIGHERGGWRLWAFPPQIDDPEHGDGDYCNTTNGGTRDGSHIDLTAPGG